LLDHQPYHEPISHSIFKRTLTNCLVVSSVSSLVMSQNFLCCSLISICIQSIDLHSHLSNVVRQFWLQCTDFCLIILLDYSFQAHWWHKLLTRWLNFLVFYLQVWNYRFKFAWQTLRKVMLKKKDWLIVNKVRYLVW
jgi:hypothetical protein